MKNNWITKIIGIVLLGLFFSKSANADNLPLKLFGIKIYDDAKLYVDLNDGKTSESRPGILTYRHTEEKPFSNLIENSNLNNYILRTDMLNQVLIVIGSKIIDSKTSPENFKNKCKTSQNNYKNVLADYYQVNKKRFIKEYYKSEYNDGKIYLISTEELEYNKNNKKLVLMIHCSYLNFDNKVYSWLYISLFDKEYFTGYTLLSWKKTEPFDDSLITSNLKGF